MSKLIYIPDFVREAKRRGASVEATKQRLLQLAKEGKIELRQGSLAGRLSKADRALAVEGKLPNGAVIVLDYMRVL